MADTTIESGAYGTLHNLDKGIGGPYWISTTTGAFVTVDISNDLKAWYTTDGGANWTGSVLAAETVRGLAVLFDRDTPGSTGTLIHVCYLEDVSDTIVYVTFNVNTQAWSTPATASMTVSSTDTSNRCFITRGRAGHIVLGGVNSLAVGCWEIAAGALSAIASPYEGNALDRMAPAYCDTDDDADVAVWFWDISADRITLKVYDDSGDSWAESTTGELTAADNTNHSMWDTTIRHSDGASVLVVWNANDAAGADLLAAHAIITATTGQTIVSDTNVLTDPGAEYAQCTVFINQSNDDVYAAWFQGGTWASEVDVYYSKSTNDMSTWGTPVKYNEDAADDYRVMGAGGLSAAGGGRFMIVWFDDDDNDIFTNLTNDIEIAAVGGGGLDIPIAYHHYRTMMAS